MAITRGRVSIALLLGLLLLACQRTPQIVVQKVEVPVAIPCPEPVVPVRPELPLSTVGPGSPADLVVKAYAASVEMLKGYAKELERIVEGFRRK